VSIAPHRLGWALAGCAAGLLLIVVGSGPLEVRAWFQPERALVSDVEGELDRIVVHYVRSFHDASFPTLADLFDALPRDTAVHVVVAERAEFDHLVDALDREGIAPPDELTAVVTGFSITPWAKDRFGTFHRGQRPVLGLPPDRSRIGGARGNDARVPELLCREIDGLDCEALPFRFEGGDLLSDGERIYVPANLPGRNPGRAGDELLPTIAQVAGRDVTPIGDRPSDIPDHHIGMVVTPLGNGVVAVADPDWGRALVGESPAAPIEVEDDEERYLPFRAVAAALEDEGLTVVRVPMVLTSTPRVYATYNNALVETRDDGRHIYMPVYDLPELDGLAAGIFEDQGLTVHPIRVEDLYEHTGSLRCLVGVISRR